MTLRRQLLARFTCKAKKPVDAPLTLSKLRSLQNQIAHRIADLQNVKTRLEQELLARIFNGASESTLAELRSLVQQADQLQHASKVTLAKIHTLTERKSRRRKKP